ncbi:MAG: substrate-binding domain-containing protein [Lachnospiraceae bacterium]|uniref:substrate-binding domain-containing protein n=1 Tax=Candidatus Merdisoma sp. JLR.KK006 TaxID=3112626 RepID=UPI002FF05816|nr:substrate-binding domain-containing protein [Lachnospiraceae bacterium]
MMKKFLALMLSVSMIAGLAACGSKETEAPATDAPAAEAPAEGGDDAEAPAPAADGSGKHIFMFKSTGNSFGDLMYEGYSEYMSALGYETEYTSPAETTVAAQVQMLDELITKGVASIVISTNGDTGYDEVFQKAKDAGIPIVSIDSEASVNYRLAHINQAEVQDIGSYLVQAAVLITLGVDYPEDKTMEEVVAEQLGSYSGDEIVLGVLSAGVDTPVQNSWIAAMEVELAKDMYAGKVSPELDKKYGNDDPTESTTQANAFVAENKVDCIISPTTVGIAAAGQVLKQANSEIKLTGLGLPSEMQSFMPNSADEDAFTYVCPYMMLWDVIHLGAVAGAAIDAALTNGWAGTDGETFTMAAFRDYAEEDYSVYTQGDGTFVLAGTPYIFYKGNMAEWIDKL